MKPTTIIATLVVSLSVANGVCSTPATDLNKCSSLPDKSARNKCYENAIRQVKAKLIEDFKDPSSVQYRNVVVSEFERVDGKGKGRMVCGEVNAKNSFGAYVGFKRFAGSPDDRGILWDKGPEDVLSQLLVEKWASWCGNPIYFTSGATQPAKTTPVSPAIANCIAESESGGLKGDARKQFMKECLTRH